MFNRRNFRQGPMVLQPMQDGMIDIDNNSGNIDIDFMQAQEVNTNINQEGPSMGNTMAPIIEPMRERVVNRTIEHVVPHA